MATSLPTDITCPICMDKYSLDAAQNPVMLPNCGHTLCRDCLKSIQHTRKADHVCPICRAPLNGINPKNLPANFLVLSMMQAHLDSTEDMPSNHHEKISQEPADKKDENRLQWEPSHPSSPPRTAPPVPTAPPASPLRTAPPVPTTTMSTRSRRSASAQRPSVLNESSPSRLQEMDVQNPRLVPLYLARSVKELDNMVEDIPSKPTNWLVNLAENALRKAYIFDERNDQEKAYVTFMRYFAIVSKIKKQPEYKKNWKYLDSLFDQETTNQLITRAVVIHESLERRYTLQNACAVYEEHKFKKWHSPSSLKIPDIQ